METTREFTPAAGNFAGVEYYDLLIRLLTRERTWRPQLLDRIAPEQGQRLMEVGCGTGTLAIAAKLRCPQSSLIAIDPDPAVLGIARGKAQAAGAEIDFRQGFLDEQDITPGTINTIYCSLVLHQVPLSAKGEIIAQMAALLAPGGTLHIADYGRQSGLMRGMFRMTVQRADGVTDTQPNADGFLENALGSSRFTVPIPDRRIATPTGTISLFSRKLAAT